jgi:hypothetical protein
MAYLAERRKDLEIPALGNVEIRVDFESQDGSQNSQPNVWLQCIACGKELVFTPSRDLYECPECSYGMTYDELQSLCNRQVTAMTEALRTKDTEEAEPEEKKGGFLWRFIGYFVRKKAPKTLES